MINNIDDIKNLINKNVNILVKEFNISLIYIFGSYAKGTNNEQSDIDIAVLLDGKIDRYTKINILGNLVDIFKREDIDLVILNSVDEILSFQVIKYGEVIYMDSLYTKTMFEYKVMSRYMDMKHFRATQQRYTHKRFLEIMNREENTL